MGGPLAFVTAGIFFLALGIIVAKNTVRRRPRYACLDRAQRLFRLQREHLEAKLIDLAQVRHHRGTPRWIDCAFEDDVTYVRNRRTGQLSAFVAITVTLPSRRSVREFDPGYASEDVLYRGLSIPAAGDLRLATAIFSFVDDRWTTEGRTIFNLSPAETARFYQHDLKVVGENLAAGSSALQG